MTTRRETISVLTVIFTVATCVAGARAATDSEVSAEPEAASLPGLEDPSVSSSDELPLDLLDWLGSGGADGLVVFPGKYELPPTRFVWLALPSEIPPPAGPTYVVYCCDLAWAEEWLDSVSHDAFEALTAAYAAYAASGATNLHSDELVLVMLGHDGGPDEGGDDPTGDQENEEDYWVVFLLPSSEVHDLEDLDTDALLEQHWVVYPGEVLTQTDPLVEALPIADGGE